MAKKQKGRVRTFEGGVEEGEEEQGAVQEPQQKEGGPVVLQLPATFILKVEKDGSVRAGLI